jgi:hypothetical protein
MKLQEWRMARAVQGYFAEVFQWAREIHIL